MSKANALAGLIGTYGDSGDESDEGGPTLVKKPHMLASESATFQNAAFAQGISTGASATIHPAPIPHCPWSACYDETSGFTYYWNQQTSAVTWEAPPEYLLALKLAQQQLNAAGSAEVSAEEWQLYQQALAEKQHAKVISKPASIKKPAKPIKGMDKNSPFKKNSSFLKKRRFSDNEEEKIELITSYHNSDSESDLEPESPVKKPALPPPLPVQQPPVPKIPKNHHKKTKTKPVEKNVEYGPTLPPNLNYSIPIGPEMPQELLSSKPKSPVPQVKVGNGVKEEDMPIKIDMEDSQDENTLLKKLKDKAKLLEKLGGELPSGLDKIIRDESSSGTASPAKFEDKKSIDIDDLLDEIEKKELPKKRKIDMFDEDSKGSIDSSRNSPRSGIHTPASRSGTNTPIEAKSLFPSSKNIEETSVSSLVVPTLFPSASSTSSFPSVTKLEDPEKDSKPEQPPLPPLPPEVKANVYLPDPGESVEKPTRKKLRICNSVLPERKKSELPSYTTKYSQHIEGFSTERVGLGFKEQEESMEGPKTTNTVSYGNGLMFTKGETLNEEKKDDDLDDLTEVVEAKLKYLNQVQPGMVSPVQEMLIQMQTLVSAFRFGALSGAYWRRWAASAAAALAAHERAAAPPGWSCAFQRSEGRYRYVRDADGFAQWEYPAVANTDMDISTTPPHPGHDTKDDEAPPPPLPPPSPPPPPPISSPRTPPPPAWADPPPPAWADPPPPAWADPPPPGCDDLPPLPPEPKQEIGDELLSFYNDIAELEMQTAPPSAPPSPPPAPPVPPTAPAPPALDPKLRPHAHKETEKDRGDKDRDKLKPSKKKSKVKISTSMGMKHKTVSTMVAKWQQVADEIHSD